MRTLFLCTVLLACGTGRLHAQVFGANPFHTKWRQIDSDTARIVFPRGLDSTAGMIAGFVNSMSRNNAPGIGSKLNKVDIVLQNQTIVANGYVGLGPFRSEFYITPPANNFELGSMPWPYQLALHEYRHVQQYNNFDNGLSAIMKRLFGEDGYALAINAAVPNWFFEGDAVYHETVLSPQGRGRIPHFLKAYPSLWQSGKKYSWMKLRNGSLKDYIPNHYDLGYLLVNYGAEKYGYDFWRKVIQDASSYKGLFYPMQTAVKKYSGIKYTDFINNAFAYYKNIYGLARPLSDSLLGGGNVFPVNARTLTSYYYPFQVSRNETIYLKTSNKDRAAFYIKNNNGERLIRYRDISTEEQFSYRSGKIVYAAYESDPRWSWLNYSVVKILDVGTGKQQTLQHKTRFFSPDISPDGKLVVANKVYLDGRSSLVVLNAASGSVITEIKKDSIAYFVNPKIISSNTVIAILRRVDATTCIGKIDLKTGTIENITPPSLTLIDQLDAKSDKVYFTAGQHIKDEIFCYDIKNKRMQKLKASGIGNYFINTGFDKISWSCFTADGYQLKQMNMAYADWQPVSMQEFIQTKNGIVNDPGYETINYTRQSHYASKPYSKLTRPVNFHSWWPNYSDPEFSFNLYGNNILNTVQTQMYYLYNQNDRTHAVGGSIVYGGLFPYITLGTEYIFNRRAVASQKIKQWNEWDNYAGLSIPLSWSSGRTYKSFSIGSNYYYRTDFNTGTNKNIFKELRFSYLAHGISWAQQVPAATQDIYPRLGYSVNTQFRHALNQYKSWQAFSKLNCYLPGFMPAHSIVLSGAAQYSGSAERIFGSKLAFARGVTAADSAGAYTIGTSYHFPICYPDFGFANLLYLQRIRAAVFYDYSLAFNKNATSRAAFRSAGTEIYFDTKWWNSYSLTLGFRMGSILTSGPGQKSFFEFILPTSLITR
ncbi:MAG: hypothetical protein QM640_07400 [Niabella sp.]